jgi:hypothetical protein
LSFTTPFERRGLRVAEQGYLALLDYVQAVCVVALTQYVDVSTKASSRAHTHAHTLNQ